MKHFSEWLGIYIFFRKSNDVIQVGQGDIQICIQLIEIYTRLQVYLKHVCTRLEIHHSYTLTNEYDAQNDLVAW